MNRTAKSIANAARTTALALAAFNNRLSDTVARLFNEHALPAVNLKRTFMEAHKLSDEAAEELEGLIELHFDMEELGNKLSK